MPFQPSCHFPQWKNPHLNQALFVWRSNFAGCVGLWGCCSHGIQLPYHPPQRSPDYMYMSPVSVYNVLWELEENNAAVPSWRTSLPPCCSDTFETLHVHDPWNVLRCVPMRKNNKYEIKQSTYCVFFFNHSMTFFALDTFVTCSTIRCRKNKLVLN